MPHRLQQLTSGADGSVIHRNRAATSCVSPCAPASDSAVAPDTSVGPDPGSDAAAGPEGASSGDVGALVHSFNRACWAEERNIADDEVVRDILPGVFFTLLMLMVAGTGFSTYLASFASYSVTYGSMASVVIALIFFYMTSIILVLGAYVNAVVMGIETSTL